MLWRNVISSDEFIERYHDAEVVISWDQEWMIGLFIVKNLKAYCAASVGFNAANIEVAENMA